MLNNLTSDPSCITSSQRLDHLPPLLAPLQQPSSSHLRFPNTPIPPCSECPLNYKLLQRVPSAKLRQPATDIWISMGRDAECKPRPKLTCLE